MATLNLARGYLWRTLVSGRDSDAFSFLLSQSVQRTATSDLLVDLSGDMLTEDYGAHVAYSHFIPILRALAVGTPYMLCAQSIGPFRFTKPLARFVLNRAVVVTVRDEITLIYLKDLGVDMSRVRQTADLAFLLSPAGPEETDARLREAGIGRDDRRVLGVSVSRLVASKYDQRVGSDGAFVEMFARTIGRFALENDLRVIFTPHVTGPSAAKDDRFISRNVRKAMPSDVDAHVIEADLRPEEIKAIIARCAAFVGTRMHANIAALSSHVPTVAISYSHKTPGIMRACGVERLALPVERLTEAQLSELLAEVYSRRNELSANLERAVAEQRRLAAMNFDILLDLLNERGLQ